MDAQLGMIVAQYLLPFLPALSAGASKYAEGFLQKAGEGSYEFTSSLWAKLKGRRQQLDAAAQDVADNQDDADAAASFRFQLKKLFSENPELAQEISNMLESQQAQITASGDRSVAVSGNITSSAIVTGDNNLLGTSKDEN